jgi:tryptophan halogenase
MAASVLGYLLDGHRLSITLVESEAIGTVGVGEATIPPILLFNKMLGISEQTFLKRTKGTIKLGIEFCDWKRLGHSYLHPFGDFGTDIETIPMHHFWLRQKAAGHEVPDLFSFSLMAEAARKGRFTPPAYDNPRSVLSGVHYAYQFDAGLYAAMLRDYAEHHGVRREEGKVVSVERGAESGHVTQLILDDGREIEGELFIDCSGFRGLLIGGAMDVDYVDWREWLPCDRAFAVGCEMEGDPIPYTRATARDAGWQWRIPLQHRTGNGHVFCSEFQDPQDALDILIGSLDGAPLSEPKALKFTTGHRERFWDGNVVALGLAAGFLEPLESTSIHLVQTGLARLMANFPDKRFSPTAIKTFNTRTLWEYERIRDFLVLHYTQTERDDTAFWRHCQQIALPPDLDRKISMFRETGRIKREDQELFTESSWLAVMHGQGVEADAWDPMVERFPIPDMARRLDSMHSLIDRASDAMPTHGDFLRQVAG